MPLLTQTVDSSTDQVEIEVSHCLASYATFQLHYRNSSGKHILLKLQGKYCARKNSVNTLHQCYINYCVTMVIPITMAYVLHWNYSSYVVYMN